MQVSTPLWRDWNTLPAEMKSVMLHHLCEISFEQLYAPTRLRTEPSPEFLQVWCEENLKQIFTTEKTTHTTWRFLFWSREDFEKFLSFLKSPAT